MRIRDIVGESDCDPSYVAQLLSRLESLQESDALQAEHIRELELELTNLRGRMSLDESDPLPDYMYPVEEDGLNPQLPSAKSIKDKLPFLILAALVLHSHYAEHKRNVKRSSVLQATEAVGNTRNNRRPAKKWRWR